MDTPAKKEENENIATDDIAILKQATSNAAMRWIEWAEKRVLVILVIWVFVLLYKKDQELSAINREIMHYLMEEKKSVKLSIQSKQDVIEKLSNDEIK